MVVLVVVGVIGAVRVTVVVHVMQGGGLPWRWKRAVGRGLCTATTRCVHKGGGSCAARRRMWWRGT